MCSYKCENGKEVVAQHSQSPPAYARERINTICSQNKQAQANETRYVLSRKGNTPYSELRPCHYETERAGSDGEVLVAGRCCLPEVGVVEEQRAHVLALPINQWHASNLNRSGSRPFLV